MDEPIIKNNIRILRKKAGLTQEQLAEKVGISQVHLGRLMATGRNHPRRAGNSAHDKKNSRTSKTR